VNCVLCKLVYSGILIYRSYNDCLPACTVRHFWSRMKFHINNVIYSCIHRPPNYCFTALTVCKSRSWHSISRMDRLKKKIEAKYLLFALPSLWTINVARQQCSHTSHMALSSGSVSLASFPNLTSLQVVLCFVMWFLVFGLFVFISLFLLVFSSFFLLVSFCISFISI